MNLADLQPKEHVRVIDLLVEAGMDVVDWSKFKGGKEKAASNPKYCYNWSFCEDQSKLI